MDFHSVRLSYICIVHAQLSYFNSRSLVSLQGEIPDSYHDAALSVSRRQLLLCGLRLFRAPSALILVGYRAVPCVRQWVKVRYCTILPYIDSYSVTYSTVNFRDRPTLLQPGFFPRVHSLYVKPRSLPLSGVVFTLDVLLRLMTIVRCLYYPCMSIYLSTLNRQVISTCQPLCSESNLPCSTCFALCYNQWLAMDAPKGLITEVNCMQCWWI